MVVMVKIPEEMKEIFNLEEEVDENLKKLAEKEQTVLILLAAPYKGVRIAPGTEEYAQIGLSEEFGIEETISRIKEKIGDKIKKVYLILNSPGGSLNSSYKVARMIRENVENLTIFVPYISKSGGTLVALSGDEIIMGPMSELGPLDVVIPYKDGWVSALAAFRTWSVLGNELKDKSADEVPLHLQMLADKYDPLLMGMYQGVLVCMQNYATELLQSGMFKNNAEKAQQIAQSLVWGFQDHGEVINYNKALQFGLKVRWYGDVKETWELIRQWLSRYLLKSARVHFIRYVIPKTMKK